MDLRCHDLVFKREDNCKFDEIAGIARPDNPLHGGDWTPRYIRIKNDPFTSMDICVLSRTGLNFNKHFDENTGTVISFG